MKKLIVGLLVLFFIQLSSIGVSAHAYSIAFTRVTFTEAETIIEYAIDDLSVLESVKGIDANNNYFLNEEEVTNKTTLLIDWINEHLLIEFSGEKAVANNYEITFHNDPPFKSSFEFEREFNYSENIMPDSKFIKVKLYYSPRQDNESFKIEDIFYLDDPKTENYGNFLNIVEGESIKTTVLFSSQRKFIIKATPKEESSQNDLQVAKKTVDWQRFFFLGSEHILFGYDHLLFLISLIILRMRLRELVKIITSFTIAHSITLALAVLGIFTLPSKLVEAVIAISIIYVAFENIFFKEQEKHRWWITFLFGLIHGLGFAGILMQINLPTSQLTLSLVSFNVGIEVMQVLILLLLLPFLRYWQRSSWYKSSFTKVNALIIIVGLIWLIQRIV